MLFCCDILKHCARTKIRFVEFTPGVAWRLLQIYAGLFSRATSTKVLLLLGCLVPFSHLLFLSHLLPPTLPFVVVFFFFFLLLTSLRAGSRTC